MLEAWQTLFAGLTLVVFVVTASIALVQLRHLRKSYQMTTASALLQNYWTPQFQAFMHYVFFEIQSHLETPQFREELRSVPVDKTKHPEVYVCEYYSLIGAYIKGGLMPEDIFLANGSRDAIVAWRQLSVPIAIMREGTSPMLYRDFEDLAVICERYLTSHGER